MAVTTQDYYQLLGVNRNAKPEEISKAFKKLARKYHPDFNHGDKNAEERFKEINEAYDVLKDPEKRKLYDQFGHDFENARHFSGQQGGGGGHFTFNGQDMGGADFSDIFENLFGGGRSASGGFGSFGGFQQKPRRGRDVEAELPLTLQEALKGGKRKVTIQMPDGPKTLEITVPAGVRDGAKLRLSGQGDPSPNGGPAGDLFLRVRYQPNSMFKVDGINLQSEVDITPWQAVLGAKVKVPTLEGDVELTIPPGTSSGRKFRLRGKGMGSPANRGDLFVKTRIEVPSTLTPEEKELWEKLEKISTFKAQGGKG